MTEREINTERTLFSFLCELLFPRVAGESRGEQILFSSITFFFSFFLSGTASLFGAHPFGVAALSVARHRVFLSFAGLVIGSLFATGAAAPVYIAVYTLVFLLRVLLSMPRESGRFLPASRAYFHELPSLRLSVAAVAGLAPAVYQILVGGMSIPSLLYSLGMVLLCPVFAFLFLAFYECDFTLPEIVGLRKLSGNERLSRFGRFAPYYLTVSEISLGAVLVLSLWDITLFGFSFSYMTAAFLTMYASNRKDALTGALAGLVLVLPVAAIHAPAFALLGFLSGILWRFGSLYAIVAGVAAESVYLAVTGGLVSFVAATPESLMAVAIFWPLFEGIRKKRASKKAAGENLVCYQSNTDLEHMKRLSEAFLNLSGTFRSMSEFMKKPDKAETAALCHRIVATHCTSCDKREACAHKTSESLTRSVSILADKLCRGERDLQGVFNEAYIRDCGHLGAILTDILSESGEDAREKEKNGTGDLLSADYAMLSRILADAAARDKEERAEDKRLSTDLCSALESHGGFRGDVSVFGTRQKQILVAGSYWEGERLSVEQIRILFEQMCCCRLSEPTFDFSGGQMTMQTHTVPRFEASFVSAGLAGGGEVSGDVIRSFQNSENYFYALLSDGMGSGKMASMTAELTGAYLSELLSSGVHADTALKMLNQVVRQKGCECSATIDLLELDLLYGKAAFIKSGAATSYVRRGNDVFRIRSKTMPIGLLRTIDAERIHFDLASGDFIILLSDGISQVPEDAPWLISLITDGWEPNPPTMADKIVEAAKAAGRRDDMSVAIVEIKDCR